LKEQDQENSLPADPRDEMKKMAAGLCLSALLISGCATQATDDVTESTVSTEKTASEVPAHVPDAPAEPVSAKLAPPAKAPIEASQPKVQADEPLQIETRTSSSSTAKTVSKGEQAADALVASLAAKDKFSVIKKAPKPQSTPKQAVTPKKAKATKVASASVKVTAPEPRAKLVKKALDIGLSDLPVTVEMWTIGNSPADNSLQISTPTWQMGEGSYLSQVWVTLNENALRINSSSDIDPAATGSGVVLNGGALIPFSRIEDNNIAVVEGEWMTRLSDGGTMEIYMGFFPGKVPASPTFKSDASLDALTRLVPTFDKLAK